MHDAKTGDNITSPGADHFEQENKEAVSRPIASCAADPLLRRQHADAGAALSRGFDRTLTREQEKFREQIAQAFGGSPFGALEDQVRRNMDMFQRTFALFTPFAKREGQSTAEPDKGAVLGGGASTTGSGGGVGDIDDLKRQMEEMRQRLELLSDKDKT